MGREAAERQQAIVWHTLAKVAERAIKDLGLRDQLDSGASHKVLLTIAGTVDRHKVSAELAGSLNVGHDGITKRTESPSAAHIAALALSLLPTAKATAFREMLRGGDWSAVSPAELDEAIELIERARRQLPDATRRGAVSFLPLAVAKEAA